MNKTRKNKTKKLKRFLIKIYMYLDGMYTTDGTSLLSILKSSSESGTKPCPPRSRRKVRFNVTEEKKTVPEINDVDFFNTMLFNLGKNLHSPSPGSRCRFRKT